jgi:hypothetical protein
MKVMQVALSVVMAVSSSLGVACSGTNTGEPAMRPASRTDPDSAQRPATNEGINDISVARCDREVRCGGVGSGKNYETREACIADLNSAGYEDLDAKACPRGLDARELDKCLSENHAERSAAPLDTLERLVACRAAALCRD